MPSRIIVCGIYRSGTSLTTQIVREWGAYAGKTGDLFEDEFGYLEHLALQQFNDELLDNNSRVPTPESVLIGKSKHTGIIHRANQILADMDYEADDAGQRAWVWKDPRLPLTLPFWRALWGGAVYVIPVRHPVETIYSAAKMEGIEPDDVPLSVGLAYWQYCMVNILKYTRENPRTIFISYDRLISHPIQECERLSNFLDDHCQSGTKDNGARVDRMASHIQEGRHHFQSPASFADIKVASREQRALYNFLRVKTLYPQETFHEDDFALHPGWLESIKLADALTTMISNEQKE